MGEPAVCGCCGRPTSAEPLLAACDVLAFRALERVGKLILRASDVGRGVDDGRALRASEGRFRFRRMQRDGFAWHEAHTVWRPDDATIERGLDGVWDLTPLVVDAHGCCGLSADDLAHLLHRYVVDLLVTQTGHDVDELRYRLAAYLTEGPR